MALYLFDIDMTLLDSAGAGREAMDSTLLELFGIEQALAEVSFAGRTDADILRETLLAHGLFDDGFAEILPRLIDVYVAHLAEVLPGKNARVLSGVRELVDALAAAADSRLGLATGNFRRAAMLKLSHFGLDEHLQDGGFGDHCFERRQVVADAYRRLDGSATANLNPSAVFVVGDTPHDVGAAKANGFRAVAVATGFHSLDALAAAGADYLFQDFSDHAAVLAALLAAAGRDGAG